MPKKKGTDKRKKKGVSKGQPREPGIKRQKPRFNAKKRPGVKKDRKKETQTLTKVDKRGKKGNPQAGQIALPEKKKRPRKTD